MHRLAQGVILPQGAPRQPVAMMGQVREGNVPDGERDQPVGQARGALELHRPSGRERTRELRRAHWLYPPHARRAPRGREPDHDARDEPAAAHRHDHRPHGGQLRGDFESHRRLPRDDVRVVERWHPGEPLARGDPSRPPLPIPRRAPGEHHFAAPLLHARDLDRGRGLRHHDDRADSQQLSRVRYGLTMVAARVGDDALAPCGLRQAAHRVVGTADFERPHRLEVLELQVGVERLHVAERRVDRDAAQPLGRLADVLGGDHAYFFFRWVLVAELFDAGFGAADLGAGASASSSPSSPVSSSSSLTTRATSTTRSPGVRFMIFTPWVLRPEMRMPSTGTRIMIPFLVIIMSSSSGRTSFSATMSPVLSPRFSVIMPRPPRCCTRYSSSSESLPIPFSVTVSSVDLRRTTTMSITWSFLSSSIPFTPVAVRPMSRTSFSWKRMLMPWCVASTMSFRPSVTCTSISSSPFSILMARMPTERGVPNSESTVFLTTPCLVANRRYWSSENSRTGTSDARRSSGFNAMHEMIGLPRAARAACGISCTLSQ